jgi:hypothetical protein
MDLHWSSYPIGTNLVYMGMKNYVITQVCFNERLTRVTA